MSALQLRTGTLVSGSWDATVKIWRYDAVSLGKRASPAGALVGHLTEHDTEVTCVDIAPDGRRAVSASADGAVVFWQLSEPALLASTQAHTGRVQACVYAPDGRRVVTCGADSRIRVFDVDGGDVGGFSCGTEPRCIATDGHLVLAGDVAGAVGIYDLETGAAIVVLETELHRSAITCIDVAPDGQTAVTGDSSGVVVVWRL